MSEDCTPEDLKPQSPYAETKLKEEKLVQLALGKSGLQGHRLPLRHHIRRLAGHALSHRGQQVLLAGGDAPAAQRLAHRL